MEIKCGGGHRTLKVLAIALVIVTMLCPSTALAASKPGIFRAMGLSGRQYDGDLKTGITCYKDRPITVELPEPVHVRGYLLDANNMYSWMKFYNSDGQLLARVLERDSVCNIDLPDVAKVEYAWYSLSSYDKQGTIYEVEIYDTEPAPRAPTGLKAYPGQTEVTIVWEPNPEDDIKHYFVMMRNVKNEYVPAGSNQVIYKGLTPETTYSCEVYAINVYGYRSYPSSIQFTTLVEPDTQPPDMPQGFKVDELNPTAVQLSWNNNTEEDLAGYRLYRNGELIAEIDSNTRSWIDSSVEPNFSYLYELAAYDDSNNESEKASLRFTTPALPLVLEAKVDNRNINLSWTSVAESYAILLDGREVATTTDNAYTLTHMEPGTYTLKVIGMRGEAMIESDEVTVTVRQIGVPPGRQQVRDLLGNTVTVLGSMGGLLALGLALKGSPGLVAILRSIFRV